MGQLFAPVEPGERRSAFSVVGKEKLHGDDHGQFLTNPRNLVRKLAILKLIATEPVEQE